MRHLDLDRDDPHSPIWAAHLAACPRCRLAVRLGAPPPVPADPPPPAATASPIRDGPRPLRWLGAGPHGVVFEADDGGVRVALKVLKPAVAEALRARGLAAPPEHPNLAWRQPRLAAGQIVGELVDGLDLSTTDLSRDAESLRMILQQVVYGLEALAERGQRHGGLKPSNVRLSSDGRVVLTDAGLAEGDDHEGLATLVRHALPELGSSSGAARGRLERLMTALVQSSRPEWSDVRAQLGPPPPTRYWDMGSLGAGGLGEVRRVLDRELGRSVALKVVSNHGDRAGVEDVALRREAALAARLEHPGIVPVHDLGRLADGRSYYTMREVRGRTLRQAMAAGLPLTRALEALIRVGEALAYAHSQGVVHRDVKPENILLGPFGEVLLLDWGVAGVAGGPVQAGGTRGYMSPEQTEGGAQDARSDVYGLGALLYEIVRGRPPEGPDPVVEAGPHAELLTVAARALARSPDARFPDAAALISAVRAWQEGAWRRERALARLDEAGRARQEARTVRASMPEHDDERRETLERDAERLELRAELLMQAALEEQPECPEAHAALADTFAERHRAAEAARSWAAAESWEARLRHHDRGRYAAYLQGEGRLDLVTDPPGAQVIALRYERAGRRLVPCGSRALGHTPIRDQPLPMGSWLLLVEAPGLAPLRYPVTIERQGRWHGVRPGEERPRPVRLLSPDELGPDDVYLPAGWFWSGGDPVEGLPSRRRWLDARIMRRYPVTNAEYLQFLDALVAAGREAEALRLAPRERGGPLAPDGAILYGRRPDGRFTLAADADGDLWRPDWPVLNVDMAGALAFAAWEASRLGQPWRLPLELEWEKAARGVDGRIYPWGDHLDPTCCHLRDSQPGRKLPASVRAHPLDESPYGVRGLAGNVRERCLDRFGGPHAEHALVPEPEPQDLQLDDDHNRTLKGASWGDTGQLARATARTGLAPSVRGGRVGFRLVRPVD